MKKVLLVQRSYIKLLILLVLLSPGITLSETIEMDCIIEPDMIVELSSPVDGIVQEVFVDKSVYVKKGQILAKLESSVPQVMVNIARTKANMDDKIKARKIERELANKKNKLVLKLFKQGSVPLLEKEEAKALALLAEVGVKQAYNDKKMAGFELEKATANLKLHTITSPIEGVVIERYVHPGESVKENPLLRLAKIDPMRVEIIVFSDLFGRIKKGMQVEVVSLGPNKSRYPAVVSLVDSIVDAASGTFGVRLNLPNADNKVIGGLKCKAILNLQ